MNFEPPKNLYTHKWYVRDGSGMLNFLPMIGDRIDSTRSKLQKLESTLKGLTGMNEYERYSLQDDMKDIIYEMEVVLYKVEWMRANIGVWSTIKHGDECDNAVLMYPRMKRSTGVWKENMFGKEKKEGYYLVMLSPEAVDWLNTLDLWIKEAVKINKFYVSGK